MPGLWRRLSSDTRGGLILEFAAAMPVLVLLLLGGVEVSRFALLNQKMDRLATVMGDLVAQADTLTTTDVDQLFLASGHVAWPFNVNAKGKIIISSITVAPPPPNQLPGPPIVSWQRSTGSLVASSAIGTTNGTATLPSGLTIAPGQTVIVAEVHFQFKPMLIGAIVPEQRIYHRAFFRPRTGALNTLG